MFLKAIKGSTLIEFIVVILIMISLTALATTSMSSTKTKNYDTLAYAFLEETQVRESSFRLVNGVFTSNYSLLDKDENVNYTNEISSKPGEVSIFVDSNDILYLATLSKSGKCFGRIITPKNFEIEIIDSEISQSLPCSADSLQ